VGLSLTLLHLQKCDSANGFKMPFLVPVYFVTSPIRAIAGILRSLSQPHSNHRLSNSFLSWHMR